MLMTTKGEATKESMVFFRFGKFKEFVPSVKVDLKNTKNMVGSHYDVVFPICQCSGF